MATQSQTTTGPGRQTLSQQTVEDGLAQLLDQGWRRLARASAHYRRHHDSDSEALHDLRVAIRRLRSLYRAFAPAICDTNHSPRALRRLFRRSNPVRDREVALALIARLNLPLPWLEQAWQAQLAPQRAKLLALPEKLDALPRTTRCDWPDPDTTLGKLAARQLKKPLRRFARQLKETSQRWDDDAAHALRIRAKQLRYLLEPFTRQHRPCAHAVSELKTLQDRIGDYRDAQLLGAELKTLSRASKDRTQRQQLRQARRLLRQYRRSLRLDFMQFHDQTQREMVYLLLQKARQTLKASKHQRATVIHD